MAGVPTGTVTFLFTDIEGSTKLARQHPDEWETARARHHAILHSAIDCHHGTVFQIIGDAFCAAFHTAEEALKAAIRAQRDLQGEEWGKTVIHVRMGIHTGAAEADGKDYRGYLTMSLVQRLMSAGHGGQILVSGATENLLRSRLPDGINLRDLGKHNFKDTPQPLRVFQIVASGLQTEFPPLRTSDLHPNNLPTQFTSFVGREKELADVKKLLQDTHLLTLIGPGGTGKTRLSIRAADDLLSHYPDGLWLVELAPISDALLVPRTAAVAMGLREDLQRPAIDLLCDYLHNKQLLLILDNCEHLVDACARMVDRILQAAPDIRILASSREALGIGGEVTYRVPSLELPDLNHLPPFDTLSQYEAVKLFIDRATSAVPGFRVTNENAPALAQICDHLDGIPLAIELAAAKVRVLSVDQIEKRLGDRFRLLTGGSRTALERHQTLRAAIDWSYNLLPPAEQLLFCRLSVFSGGWVLEAAESVCAADVTPADIHRDDILFLLEQLINKSMVVTEELQSRMHPSGEESLRYHMLETMREYASEKLMGSDALHKQYAAYYLLLAETIEPFLEKPEPALWLDKLEREHNNVRAALRWALEKSEVEIGLRLASSLYLFWLMRGHLNEGLAHMEKFLVMADGTVDGMTLAKSLDRAGTLNRYRGNLKRAHELIAESLSLRRGLGGRHGIADCLSNLGFVVLHQGHFTEARQHYSEALSIHNELGNQQGIADSLSHLALMAYYEGDFETAQVMDEDSLQIWRSLGDQQGIAWALYCLGNVRLRQGNHTTAHALFHESLGKSKEIGFKWGIAFSIEGLACLAACMGQDRRAILLAGGAFTLRQDIGIPLSPSAQADLEQLLAPARERLGEEAANKLWLKGLNVKIEQMSGEDEEEL
jgi:predicted ATPase/class 3 adenylate cyclase